MNSTQAQIDAYVDAHKDQQFIPIGHVFEETSRLFSTQATFLPSERPYPFVFRPWERETFALAPSSTRSGESKEQKKYNKRRAAVVHQKK